MVVATCATLIDNYFINSERLSLLDADIEAAAQALASSELVRIEQADQSRGEALISQRLGDNRLGKFFSVRGPHGETLFESGAAKLIPYRDIPHDQPWVSYHSGGDFIRVINLPLKQRPGAILQVGAIFQKSLLVTPAISTRDIFEMLALIAIGLFIAAVFARKILAPMRRLSEKVDEIATLSSSASVLPRISPVNLDREADTSRDEFYRLVEGLNALITRVNRGYEVSRVWSYNLAHELKTPMADMSAEIEVARGRGEIGPTVAASLEREIQAISETVSAFLLWAEVEAAPARHEMHVVSVASIVQKLMSRFETRFSRRLGFELKSDCKVAVSVAYLEIVLTNLISNALNYSPQSEPVDLILNGNRLEIVDRGGGIPADVLSRLGQPFNRGAAAITKSHGLGLATVNAIAKVFGWQVQYLSEATLGRVVLDLSASQIE
jgi:two-component system sensor histidine kinase QseC